MNILLPSFNNRARFVIVVVAILLELLLLSLLGCD
jgi:hypothetical protein